MKVGIISTSPGSSGGVSSYTSNLVNSLIEHGMDIVAFLNTYKVENKDRDSRNLLGTWDKGLLYPFQNFKALVANADIDVVHVQHEFFLYGGSVSALLFPFMLMLIRLLGKPLIVTIHGVIPLYELQRRFKEENELGGTLLLLRLGLVFLTKVIVLLSHLVIVHEDFFTETLSVQYKCSPQKICVIPHGVESRAIYLPQNEAKAKLHFEKKVIVFFFGYISKYKGIETLVEAFGQIAKKHPDWVLVIGGDINPRHRSSRKHREYLARLKQKGVELVSGQIVFTGFIPNEKLPYYLSAADIVVLPYTTAMSSSGPLSLSMSYGKPVIASDIPTLRELIPFKEALFNGNSEVLAAKLESVLSNHALKHRIANSIQEIGRRHSWYEVGRKTCLLYKTLVS